MRSQQYNTFLILWNLSPSSSSSSASSSSAETTLLVFLLFFSLYFPSIITLFFIHCFFVQFFSRARSTFTHTKNKGWKSSNRDTRKNSMKFFISCNPTYFLSHYLPAWVIFIMRLMQRQLPHFSCLEKKTKGLKVCMG